MWDFFCTFAPDFDNKSYIVHRTSLNRTSFGLGKGKGQPENIPKSIN